MTFSHGNDQPTQAYFPIGGSSFAAAQVDQVPVVREPVSGDVLAHGGHHNPVAERHAADRERAEEVDLRHLPVVVGTGRAAVGCGFLREIGPVIGHRSVSIGAHISEADVRHACDKISKSQNSLPWLYHMTGTGRADPLVAMSAHGAELKPLTP